MPRTQRGEKQYWRNLVKRTWESLRRNEEFRQDCVIAGQGDEASVAAHRFQENWGTTCNNPDLPYHEIVAASQSVRVTQASRGSQSVVDSAFPDIPQELGNLWLRLRQRSGQHDFLVHCAEFWEMVAEIEQTTRRNWNEIPVKEQWKYLAQ
jgi:hypothetical protein